jgi:hypothetical protein
MAEEPRNNVIGRDRFPPPSGSGPRDPTVEARLARLEVAIDEIRKDLQAVRLDLTEIKGKISNVPTTFQLVFMQAALMLAIFAGAFGLLKIASPH